MYYMLTAIGKNHTWEAENCAKSIKLNTPQSHVTIYSDTKPNRTKYFDKIIPIHTTPEGITTEKHARVQRIKTLIEYPIERFIHLDVDCYVAQDTFNVFDTKFDIACTYNIWRMNSHNLVPGVIYLNKTDATNQLLKLWLREYAIDPGIKDQFIFDKLAQKVNTHVLAPEYCAQVGEPTQYSGLIRIAHRHYQTSFLNAIMPTVFLNQTAENRVWIPSENRMTSSVWNSTTNSIDYQKYDVTEEHIAIAESFYKD